MNFLKVRAKTDKKRPLIGIGMHNAQATGTVRKKKNPFACVLEEIETQGGNDGRNQGMYSRN
jgi:hypothetical protein